MSTIKADNISPVGSILNLTAPVAGLSVASGLTVGGGAYFSGGATFAGVARFAAGITVGTLSTFAGITSSAILSCATVPTQGQHLTNKTYVDAEVAWYNKTWTSTDPPIGTILIVSVTTIFNGPSQTAGLSNAGSIGGTINGLRVGGTNNANRYVYNVNPVPAGSSVVNGTWKIICYMDDDGGGHDHEWVMVVRIS